MGLICPVCGAECGEMMVCPGCGWELSLGQGEMIPDLPKERCQGLDGCLEVGHFSVTIRKKIHETELEKELAYRDIRDVIFREASEQGCGFLGIRGREDPLPPVTSDLDAVCDETALVFDVQMEPQFERAYRYIQQLSRILGAEKISARLQNRICCPKCKTSRYTIQEEMYRPLRCRSKSLWIALIHTAMWIYLIWSGRTKEYVCLECGHRWYVREQDEK